MNVHNLDYKECKDEMGNLVGRMKIDKSMQTEEKICHDSYRQPNRKEHERNLGSS